MSYAASPPLIRAIETRYDGHLFRSRLEARWAVFFHYEAEGYELGDGVRYLPDFWLPNMNSFFEVKGQEPTEAEKGKCKKLSDATKKWCYIAFGPIGLPHTNMMEIIPVEVERLYEGSMSCTDGK